MTQFRKPKKTSKYYVPGEVYLTVVHFCLQYPLWKMELDMDPSDDRKGIDYSGVHVQTSNRADPTPGPAMRRAMIAKKKQIVDETAREIAGDDDKWLIMGVANGLTHYQLVEQGMDVERDTYYAMRRKFYYELSKKI